MFENLKSLLVKERAQAVHETAGISQFLVEGFARRREQGAFGEIPCRLARTLQGGGCFEEFREMVFAEMHLGLLERLELERFGLVKRVVDNLPALLRLPVGDSLFRCDDFDLFPLKLGETHPAAETLFVQPPHRDLVGVVVGRPQQGSR